MFQKINFHQKMVGKIDEVGEGPHCVFYEIAISITAWMRKIC